MHWHVARGSVDSLVHNKLAPTFHSNIIDRSKSDSSARWHHWRHLPVRQKSLFKNCPRLDGEVCAINYPSFVHFCFLFLISLSFIWFWMSVFLHLSRELMLPAEIVSTLYASRPVTHVGAFIQMLVELTPHCPQLFKPQAYSCPVSVSAKICWALFSDLSN